MARAYYNEIDPYAAAWLRELIRQGLIAEGDVDERSIVDVRPGDIRGYTQCHFFAGIGVWSYALRLAGWPDDRPVWTGSCPCQPFSAAGRGNGFADERHLWPYFHYFISQLRPSVVFGEQVASKDGLAWLDLVQADLEGTGYACGAVDLCAAGVGAPHIRQRLWFVAERLADADGRQLTGQSILRWVDRDGQNARRPEGSGSAPACRDHGGLADAHDAGLERWREPERECSAERASGASGVAGGLADAEHDGRGRSQGNPAKPHSDGSHIGIPDGGHLALEGQPATGPTNGHWRDADWLFCRDGKWRPTQPSPQPLADGSAESLGRVRPEIVAEVEEEVNAAAMEAEIEPATLLRNVWNALAAEAPRLWAAGRLPGLHEAPFLLAFLRQLAEQGWQVAQRIPVPSAEVDRERVRMLRADDRASRSPHKYGLEGQPAGKHSDAVRVLPSVLARHAHSAWGDAYQAYAETCSPLASGAPARVGRLRAYGNAIVAQAAATVIGAYLDIYAVRQGEPATDFNQCAPARGRAPYHQA